MTDEQGNGAAIATEMFNAVEANDMKKFLSLCAEGGTLWHNYDQKVQPLTTTAQALDAMHKVVKNVRYEDRAYADVSDGVAAQHVLRGTTVSGQKVEMPIMMRIFVSNGKVRHIDEYVDTVQGDVIRREFNKTGAHKA